MILPSIAVTLAALAPQARPSYPVVDTGQVCCFGEGAPIAFPEEGESFHGQDAQYRVNAPGYRDNGDGTVSDLVTGLMWTRDPGERKALSKALADAPLCRVGGHEDWRLPTVKELYSLILFSGVDPDPSSTDTAELTPFIDTSAFTGFRYGSAAEGGRIIDAQYATCTRYASTTMGGNETMFGVNFADGRIKGYPVETPRGEHEYFVLYVRGNPEYGNNAFRDNGDGTITDEATGLTWMQGDSGVGMDWREALAYAEGLELAGQDDWRLPSAKELQSIVDYTRSPDTSDSAAIDPLFQATEIENEGGRKDFGWYWTSTSHRRGEGARSAVYVAFGRAVGFMGGRGTRAPRLLDVHGAGAQRSDPKAGDASRFPRRRGPQGDAIRIDNLVRCVRGGEVEAVAAGSEPGPQRLRPPGAPRGSPIGAMPGATPAVGDDPGDSRATEASSHPNFVLILVDDLGWTGLSVQLDDRVEDSRSDFYQTPHIARLADEGMRFSRAYAAALCTPSRASILTGKTPARLHITTPGGGGGGRQQTRMLVPPQHLRQLPISEVTIAEVLGQAGYVCAHLGKWHLGRSDPGNHGFHVHDGSTGNGGPEAYSDRNPKDIFGLTERAIEFMREQVDADRPFYLQLSHYALHAPVEALDSSRIRFRSLAAGRRHDDAELAAMTHDLDTSVGTLLAELDELGLADSTYVVLTSDNGAPGRPRHPQNTPLRGGKGSFYEGGIRVPLIIRGPGIEAGSTSGESVSGCDLLPTFCDRAGVEPPAQIDGVSLRPLLEGRINQFDRSHRALLFHFPHYGQGPNQVPQSALVLGDYKLIRDLESGVTQLFDLGTDLSEAGNLVGQYPELAQELEGQLSELLEEAGAQMPTPNPDFDR